MTIIKQKNMIFGLLFLLALIWSLTGCNDGDEHSDDLDGDMENESSAEMDDSDLNEATDGDDETTDGDIDVDVTEIEEDSTEPQVTLFMDYTEDEKTVSYVDLPRYLGKWYEIATYVIPFQEGCTGSTATYALDDDSNVSVTNECYLESLDGEYKVDTARAEIVNAETNAELIVYFTESIGADYWIIELDGQDSEEPYEWAVVGSSLSVFLWILSRTPQMEEERLEAILTRLEERGYDTERLSFTPQKTDSPEEDN